MYESILVPTDGSTLSDAAIKEAANLAKELHSKLVLFYAIHMEGLSPPIPIKERELTQKAMEDEAKQVLASAAKNSNLARLTVEQMFAGSNWPYEAIIDAAKDFKCDLIVMASHGRHGISGVLLGSETQKVLTHSKVPVLVVH